jgi:hypothetical protein
VVRLEDHRQVDQIKSALYKENVNLLQESENATQSHQIKSRKTLRNLRGVTLTLHVSGPIPESLQRVTILNLR